MTNKRIQIQITNSNNLLHHTFLFWLRHRYYELPNRHCWKKKSKKYNNKKKGMERYFDLCEPHLSKSCSPPSSLYYPSANTRRTKSNSIRENHRQKSSIYMEMSGKWFQQRQESIARNLMPVRHNNFFWTCWSPFCVY